MQIKLSGLVSGICEALTDEVGRWRSRVSTESVEVGGATNKPLNLGVRHGTDR